jgi:2-haloacid dehalogenase
MTTTELPFSPADFDALTFDTFGTLIDWEAGILAAAHPVLAAHGVGMADDALLAMFAHHEHVVEQNFHPYRQVLGMTLAAIGDELGFVATDAEQAAFGASVPAWPAFDDAPTALARLKNRYRLYTITNCDDDLYVGAAARLGNPWDGIFTAGTIGSYKPNPANFHYAFERIPFPPSRILHVAQSLFHDHQPAQQLGMTTVWVNRRGRGPTGAGATPASSASFDLEVPDMATLASALVA